jgi:hypothetical protein
MPTTPQERDEWPGLKAVVIIERLSLREIPGASPGTDKFERETRFYITSLAWLAHQIGPAIRSHWAIENSLHWVMDTIFRDDECRGGRFQKFAPGASSSGR